MKKTFALALVLLTAAFFAPQARADKGKDCKFLGEAADGSVLWSLLGSLAETNTTNFALPPGQLSQTNSTNAAIQSLGGLLTTNHSVLFSNATTLQQTNGCHGTNELSHKELKVVAKLSRLTGPKFDKAFLAIVIEETSDALKEAREAAVEAKSPEVRAFARQQVLALTQQLVAALEAGEMVFGGDFDDIDDH
jgi:hypothetical protein